jgi:hypothetical protein
VDVQEVMWDKEGTPRAGEYTIFYSMAKKSKIISWEQLFYTTE